MLRFDRTQLASDLRDLTPTGQIAFAAAVAERLMPAYVRYCEETGFDAGLQLRSALHCVWRHVETPSTDHAELRRQHAIADMLTNVPEEPFSDLIVAAQVATAGVAYRLRFLLGDDEKGAVRAASQGHDAAYQYAVLASMTKDIQFMTDALMEKVLSHTLVQTELTRQRRDLLDLKSAKPQELARVAATLRARAEQETVIPTTLL